jgi:folylpolyglutamate synthase/dihydropteroate synthase
VIATQSLHPRAASPEELKDILSAYNTEVITAPTIEEAMEKALTLAGNAKGILVTGSLFIAAGAKTIWSEIKH